jgi:serine/threonine-protein kinase
LWAVPFDLQRLEITGDAAPVVQGVEMNAQLGFVPYDFSDNGLLVYVRGADTSGAITPKRSLLWLDRQGREEPLAAESHPYVSPRLSPDGGRIAVGINDGINADIWIYDLVRDTLSRLTFDPGSDSEPIWTPDGERVVFASTREGGGLFSRAANGTGQVERLTSPPVGRPHIPESFSPDATLLVVRDNQGAFSDIHLWNLEREPVSETLTAAPNAWEGASAISPDGRWIAYSSNETGRFEVYVRPFPDLDGGKWQISTDGGASPVWGSQGMELFYRASFLDGSSVLAVAVETEPTFSAGTPTALFAGNYPNVYSVHPDDQRFLMLKEDVQVNTDVVSQSTLLGVVDNWFEELNRLAPPAE